MLIYLVIILSLLIGISLLGCTKIQEEKHHLKDIDFIYQTIIKNHPGPCNKEDPDFLESLNKHCDKAKERGDFESLIEFVKSFDDTHVFLEIKNNSKSALLDKNLTFFDVEKSTVCLKIPTFDFNEVNKNQFQKILNKAKHLQNYKTIVFDLRSNQGGNSEYGNQLNNIIFGEEYAKQKRILANKHQFIEWRVSQDNVQHLEDLYNRYKQEWIKNIAKALKKSLQKGDVFYKEDQQEKEDEKIHRPLPNINKKFIVIIDFSNVSAALDFIDDIKLLAKDVLLMGEETKSDRLYMEIRGVELPSGIGKFFFPIKVYRNRLRGDKVTYKPDCVIQNVNHLTVSEIVKKRDIECNLIPKS